MNTPNHTWGDSPIHEQIRTMNDTPTPIPFATDGQRTTDAECWMNYCLEAEKQLTAVTEQRDAVTLRLGNTQERMIDAERQRDRLAKACDQYSEDEILCKLQTVTAQRDRLAEALRELCIALLTDTQPDITELLNKAGVAMAAVNYSTAKKSQP
jgi:hypothetical protein